MQPRKILFLPKTSLANDILSDEARASLASLGDVNWNQEDRDYTQEELTAMLPDVEVVITSWGSPVFTDAMLVHANALKVVGHAAGSVKHLMPEAGYRRGITVMSAAKVIADSVAEYTLWAMLSMQRDLYRYEQIMKVDYAWKRFGGFANELYGKHVGIVSASMVGRKVMSLLQPFNCDVMVYDPYLSEAEASELGVRLTTLTEMFATADIVSLHAPVIPETREMITAAHFGLLRDGALFINTARSWVVAYPAMMATLSSGRIRAVLDVFDKEPLPADDPLRDMDNVFLTPHVSGHTTESRMRLVSEIVKDIHRLYNGEPTQLSVSWDRLQIMA